MTHLVRAGAVMSLMARLARAKYSMPAQPVSQPQAQPRRAEPKPQPKLVVAPQPKPKPKPKPRQEPKTAQLAKEKPHDPSKYGQKSINDLLKAHERTVWQIARKFAHNNNELRDELIQEGMMGLVHAIKKWSPSGGANLNTYAINWIKAYMHRYMKVYHNGIVRLPVNVRGGNVYRPHASLNTELTEGGGTAWIDLLADDAESQDVTTERENLSAAIRARLDDLKPRLTPIQIDLLENRYLKDPRDTLDEIGARHTHGKMDGLSHVAAKKKWYGKPTPAFLVRQAAGKTVTHERVRQIERELLGFLKLYLERFN